MLIGKHLEEINQAGILAMHMPGHKRNIEKFPFLSFDRLGTDFTETPLTDDLHSPTGMIAEAEKRLSEFYMSDHSFFGVNGSTGMILAAIRALTCRNDSVLLARNCHKSVYNAIELCGLVPHYLYPPIGKEGVFLSVPPSEVEKALQKESGIRLVVLTSPTYEGVVSDIREIAEICHRHGALLLVDEAHGAHLGFFDRNVPSAVTLGADVVVQSLHKTLPSLTQTAVLHIKGERVDAKEIRKQLRVFETSSPSYLFMTAMDACVAYCKNSPEAFKGWKEATDHFRIRSKALSHLSLMEKGSGIFSYDLSKLCVMTDQSDISGKELANQLLQKGVCIEMAGQNHIVAMTGMGDTEETLDRFFAALYAIDQQIKPSKKEKMLPVLGNAQPVCTPAEAFHMPKEFLPLREAIGRISAENVYVYPPGIPLLVAGEKVTEQIVSHILSLQKECFEIIGADQCLAVLK